MIKKILARIAIIIIGLGLTLYLFTAVYIGGRVYEDTKTPSDAIIVLGARSYLDGKVNQCVYARVEHAVNLYNDGFASKIIMSGGTDKKPVFNGTNEALEMKKIALSIDSDINEGDILIEGNSTSTYENLQYSQVIMNKNELHSAIIVTEPFHSPRANLVGNKLGMNHAVSPTQTSDCWNNWRYLSKYFLREPIVIMYYKLTNKI